MQLVTDKVFLAELREMSKKMYGGLVKAVVDIEQGLVVIDAELHADQELFLLEQGSQQENLWGINLHPDLYGEDSFVEFDSMINLRPTQGNITRGVDNKFIQKKIITLILQKVCV